MNSYLEDIIKETIKIKVIMETYDSIVFIEELVNERLNAITDLVSTIQDKLDDQAYEAKERDF